MKYEKIKEVWRIKLKFLHSTIQLLNRLASITQTDFYKIERKMVENGKLTCKRTKF